MVIVIIPTRLFRCCGGYSLPLHPRRACLICPSFGMRAYAVCKSNLVRVGTPRRTAWLPWPPSASYKRCSPPTRGVCCAWTPATRMFSGTRRTSGALCRQGFSCAARGCNFSVRTKVPFFNVFLFVFSSGGREKIKIKPPMQQSYSFVIALNYVGHMDNRCSASLSYTPKNNY